MNAEHEISRAISEAHEQVEHWPEPEKLTGSLLPVPSFDAKLLPECIAEWVSDAAERMQCPPEFIAVGAMLVPATIIGRGCGIRPKEQDDDFLCVANLWGAIVGDPSVLKTPALKTAIAPLNELIGEEREKFAKLKKDFDFEITVASAREKHLRERIEKAIKSNKSEHEIRDLKSEQREEIPAPVERRYITNDATVEKLGEILNQNPRGVLEYRDELMGFLSGLDKQGREQDRAFYLEAWNGTNPPFTYDRISRGTITIDSPCVSILGGIQPGPLTHYIGESLKGGRGNDGLIQRFQLLVYPDTSANWRLVDRKPHVAAKGRFFTAMKNLDVSDFVALGAHIDHLQMRYLNFAPDAQELFFNWWTEHELNLRRSDEHDAVKAHLAKYRSLMPKLALICHLTDLAARGTGERCGVSLAATQKAAAWCDFLEAHAKRIYAMGIRREASVAKLLAAKIRANRLPTLFTARDVYRHGWANLSEPEQVDRALVLLEDCEWVRRHSITTDGRPKTLFRVNPRVLVEGDSDEVV